MSIGKEFLVENFPLFCIVIGLTFICIQNYTTYRRVSRYILIIMAETLLLSVFLVCERYLKNEGNVLGATIFSYLGYTLRPITLFLFIRLADTRVEKIHWLSALPLFINAVVYSLCFIPGAKEYLFTYQVLPDGTLQFVRGSILNFFSHFISALYLSYLIYVSLEKLKGKHISQAISILFCAVSVIVAVVVESIFFNRDLYLLNASIAVSTLFYYLFLYTERTKCDPLTGLFNRETYTTDLKKLNRYINAIIQLDMNGLKYLNDTFGHQAGDKALVTLAGIIEKCSKETCIFIV